MKDVRTDNPDHSLKTNREQISEPAGQSAELNIAAVRAGEWIAAEELKVAGLQALREGKSLTIDLAGIEHLDAGVLQAFLAIEAEQAKAGNTLRLLHASPDLHKWFEYAGASAHLSMLERSCDA